MAVYADLVIQALPPFAVGVLYDTEGAWRLAVKYVPFNWCSYSYVQRACCLTGILKNYLVIMKWFEDYIYAVFCRRGGFI